MPVLTWTFNDQWFVLYTALFYTGGWASGWIVFRTLEVTENRHRIQSLIKRKQKTDIL